VKSLSEIACQLLRLRICAEEVSLVSEEFRKAAARPRDSRIGESELLGNATMLTGEEQIRLHPYV
jgi:hypothetical protein